MNEKESVKRVFSKSKHDYVTSSTHSTGSDLALMVEWLKPESTMTVLDIATGGGYAAKTLANHVDKVIATDITEEMLTNTAQHLKSHQNISYTVADAEDLPFKNNSFDIITCRIAAHHFPNPEHFVREVSRVLKANGQFLLIDNISPEDISLDKFINKLERMRDYSHFRSYSISEWRNLFANQNLRILKENTRKKRLPYHEWVHRTLDDEEGIQKVDALILEATESVHDYFQIKIENNRIASFAIDEWMVLSQKSRNNIQNNGS
ncbi:class I SAM-dependent methyltransferase [Virgibacillus doumboii]|uniref:class I SAM-dependent methyltransferase n=1 Tax=Virgibacillus doumboii TaxID=2697503 RepID=UPI0013DF4A15|nr:methyltransferase domain-containing protein [Virgibacillus doumboii]